MPQALVVMPIKTPWVEWFKLVPIPPRNLFPLCYVSMQIFVGLIPEYLHLQDLHLQLTVWLCLKPLRHVNQVFSEPDFDSEWDYIIIESPLGQVVSPHSSVPDCLLNLHKLLAQFGRDFLLLLQCVLKFDGQVIPSCKDLKFKLIFLSHSAYVLPVVFYFVLQLHTLGVLIFFQESPNILNLIKPFLVRDMGYLSQIIAFNS